MACLARKLKRPLPVALPEARQAAFLFGSPTADHLHPIKIGAD